jgi:carboxymethylenebutenolidase
VRIFARVIQMGEFIAINAHDGGKFEAYLAKPAAGRGPGLIVIQEIFGVNSHIRDVCERWAKEGYVALAPDMFWRIEPHFEAGYTPEEAQRARAMRPKFNFDLAVKDLAATLSALRARPECAGQVGVVGYCLGGNLAYRAAAHTDVDVAIAYYGGGVEQLLDDAKRIKCPIMFHYGETDASITAEAREKTRAALAHHAKASFFVYPDAGHGFANDARPVFNQAATQLARERTLALLRETIGPKS